MSHTHRNLLMMIMLQNQSGCMKAKLIADQFITDSDTEHFYGSGAHSRAWFINLGCWMQLTERAHRVMNWLRSHIEQLQLIRFFPFLSNWNCFSLLLWNVRALNDGISIYVSPFTAQFSSLMFVNYVRRWSAVKVDRPIERSNDARLVCG